VPTVPLQARPVTGPFRSRRLLTLAGDDRLVEQLRVGNEVAFEVAFERHGAGILSFCRHMLGSREDAEDVLQHTFAATHRALLGEERTIALKPWLYTIARNRCMSVLRARREVPSESCEAATTGLAEEVERRAELRELLADVRELPEEQRSALLLAEVADLSHAEAAGVLGCEDARVKALIYRARQSLIERREARSAPCEHIREQLANLRGGALRRSELRHHLRDCPGCRAFREQVKRQRGQLAIVLPVVPSLGLKSSVLGAAGLGGGSAGGAAAVAALGASSAGPAGGGALAKVALIGVLAGGGVAAGDAAIERGSPARTPGASVELPASEPAPRPGGPRRASGEPRGPVGEARAPAGVSGTKPRGHVPAAARPARPGHPGQSVPTPRARARQPDKPSPRSRGVAPDRPTVPADRGPARRREPDEAVGPGRGRRGPPETLPGPP
jgi:RNA polymerase sigma factor (sigma-70 family)